MPKLFKGAEHYFPGRGPVILYRGKGCEACGGIGYQGRVGIFEYLEMDNALVEALHTGDPMKFGAAAKAQPGFQTLRRSAIVLAAQGITTMDQVVRATYSLEE